MMGQMVNAVESSSASQVIWGTNINYNDLQIRIKNFLGSYIEIKDAEDEEDFTKLPYYVEQINQLFETETNTLEINCEHIYQFDEMLYRQLENYPTDVIPAMDMIATQLFREVVAGHQNVQQQQLHSHLDSEAIQQPGMTPSGGLLPPGVENQFILCRLFNMRRIYQIRDLDPRFIDKMITIKGIVIRNSDVIPEMKEACFRCDKCGHIEMVYLQMGKVQEPDMCKQCRAKQSFQIIHNRSMFGDLQHVKLQETPESVPEGETPQTIHLCAYDDHVDFVKPGDRVEVIGIYKAAGVRVNSQKRTLKNVYRTYIDVVNFVKADSNRFSTEDAA